MKTQLILGDCIDKLKELESNSVDSIVTDPPYGLSFMGKKWDYDVPSQEIWEECIRVLKPGGHLLSFGGSRTYHRMAVRIEDAGFEIRDQIMWIYGSGFPKSHNIGKSIDKKAGNEREVVGETTAGKTAMGQNSGWNKHENRTEIEITKGNSEWEGWGTALKPAHEPIVMARKPLIGTVADNVLEWGTGGINIDGCRIGYRDEADEKSSIPGSNVVNEKNSMFGINGETYEHNTEGRFPANIIFECTCENPKVKDNTNTPYNYTDKNYSENGFLPNVNAVAPYNYNDEGTGVIHTDPNCPCYILDEQSGDRKGFASQNCNNQKLYGGNAMNVSSTTRDGFKVGYNDNGGASRFFKTVETTLKPSHEPIVMARKPFKGTVVDNVLEYGVGGINIDGCRIATDDKDLLAMKKKNDSFSNSNNKEYTGIHFTSDNRNLEVNTVGRFPANIIFDEEAGKILDEQSGTQTGQRGIVKGTEPSHNKKNAIYGDYSMVDGKYAEPKDGLGGASRFFYCPKSSKRDRNEGMPEEVGVFIQRPRREDGSVIYKETHPEEWTEVMSKKPRKEKTSLGAAEEILQERKSIGATFAGNQTTSKIGANPNKPTQARANIHPTVKPTELMKYLIRLVTPKGGIVLDPFMGSGSTGKAAVLEGMEFIGIEREPEYFEIAEQRINHVNKPSKHTEFFE